ncbi:MAG: adenylate/guanylate cyclase domain-containing protein [Elusimicrobia bacterium]|nr:adenylate/guanylate cyclase domain-containing protein [Elusimicrobiota bacterium]
MKTRIADFLKLRYKLFISFAALLALFFLATAVAYQSSRRTRELTAYVEGTVYPAHELGRQLHADFRYLGELYSSAIMFKNTGKLEKAHQLGIEIQDKLKSLLSFGIIGAASSQELSKLFPPYLETGGRAARNMVEGADFGAMAADLAQLGEISRQLNAALQNFQKALHEELTGELEIIDQMARRTMLTVGTTAILVLVLAAALSLLVTYLINRPIAALMQAMTIVKHGDLDSKIVTSGRGEIAVLGEHFDDMIKGLRDREHIRETFKRYVAPSVVDEVLKDPNKLRLGGEVRIMTVIFADLTGFTTISEKMKPTQLVSFLNEYFDDMVKIILDHKGTFDKFEGDLVMAFWGAPLEQSDHATRAALCCLDMQKRVRVLNQDWAKRGLPHLDVRIGVNSGEMLVGNLGSKGIMSYTVMGDAVNLGSRLESGGKNYGTFLTISETTYAMAKNAIECRELDVVRVKGKQQPIKIYELLARRGGLTAPQQALLERFDAGVLYYRNRRWPEALKAFEQCLINIPDDAPSKIYIERCRRFQEAPPHADWDGVYIFETK